MKKIIRLIGVLLLLLNVGQPAFPHGTVIYPPSRIYNCYNSPSSSVCEACGDAIYNWMGVLQPDTDFGNHSAFVPDGQIASGGNGGGNFSCLDELTTEWPTTRVNYGNIDVRWQNTAPHKTQYYKVYITPLNWDPTKPLRWDELTEIGYLGKGPAEPFSTIKSYIPESYAGKRAAIVSVWQRDYNDSHEAFYSVSDILIDGNGGGCNTGDAVGVTFENITNCSLDYYQNNSLQGSANAGGSYNANTTVGSQWEARNSSGDQIDSFTVVCEQLVYTSSGNCDTGNACDGIEEWTSTATYIEGDRVALNGIEYRAKWWNQGANPEQNSGQYQVWENLGTCSGDNGCSNGDLLDVSFANNTDCTLEYYSDNSLIGSAAAGGTFQANTAVGSTWEARKTSGEPFSNFTVTCNQTTYNSTGTCNNDNDGCAEAYGPYPNVYMAGDIVSEGGNNYECQVDNLFNVTPGTAAHWWKDLGPCSNASTSQRILLYPVPTVKGTLTVEIQDKSVGTNEVLIFDRTSQLVLQTNISGAETKIDVSGLKPGIYYVYIEGSKEPQRIRVE